MERPLATRRRRNLDADYFHRIDTEQKAYWLGFLAADGCVTKGGQLLTVTLAAVDADHLYSLRDELKSNHAVTRRRRLVRGKAYGGVTLNIHSSRLCDGLSRHGVVPRKSLIAQPWDGPPELVRHYWRGVVDGDGTVTPFGTCAGVRLCGSLPMMQGFCCFAASHTGTMATPRPSGKIWAVGVIGSRGRRLAGLLYDGAAVALSRKREAAGQLVARNIQQRMRWDDISRDRILGLYRQLGDWQMVADVIGVSRDALMLRLVRKFGVRRDEWWPWRRYRVSWRRGNRVG